MLSVFFGKMQFYIETDKPTDECKGQPTRIILASKDHIAWTKACTGTEVPLAVAYIDNHLIWVFLEKPFQNLEKHNKEDEDACPLFRLLLFFLLDTMTGVNSKGCS